jgi:TetR/AcrR family transcriptional regulator, cholesterol catabolism regulator
MEPKETANETSVARKDEVVRVAAQLFAAKGYHATTLDEIAEEMGVTKPALYYYIASKEDILQSIINRVMEPMEQVSKVGKSNLQPKEKMEAIIRMLVQFATERKETALIAFEQANILPKKSQDALKRRQKEVERVVEQTLKEGIEQGCFSVGDVRMTCFAILSVSNWLYRWYQPGGNMTSTDIADQFIKLLENGYLKAKC